MKSRRTKRQRSYTDFDESSFPPRGWKNRISQFKKLFNELPGDHKVMTLSARLFPECRGLCLL